MPDSGKYSVPKEYMSITDCSKKWRLTSEKIQKLCEEGQIPGVSKLDGHWIIPADSENPIKVEKQVVESRLSRPVIPKNRLQEAALRHIEKGEPFDVHEHVIDGKSFIVSSVFQRGGPTLEEKLVSLITRDIEKETGSHFSINDVQEMKKEARKNSNAAKATFDDYIYTYRKRLESYGFSDEDIEVLLERIAADYEPFIL